MAGTPPPGAPLPTTRPAGAAPHAPVRHPTRRERPLPFALAILLALAALGWALERAGLEARSQVAREEGALGALRRVAQAQSALLARMGRHGWIPDLEAAGLLEGLPLVGEGPGRHVRVQGYRIDVLLPRLGGKQGEVEIVLPGGAAPDPDLVRRHFAAVARPLEPGRTGYRTWYLDEQGETYVSEGVSDDDALLANALPTRLVRASEHRTGTNPILWQRAADLEALDD